MHGFVTTPSESTRYQVIENQIGRALQGRAHQELFHKNIGVAVKIGFRYLMAGYSL